MVMMTKMAVENHVVVVVRKTVKQSVKHGAHSLATICKTMGIVNNWDVPNDTSQF